MSLTHLCATAATLALAAQLGAAQPPGDWPTYPVAEAPASMRAAIQRGDLLIVSLQGALLSELRRELDAGGPVSALGSCHLDASAAAYRIARQDGIAAGRTSARLRNPTNKPRPWAAALVARHEHAQARDVAGFVVDLGDRVGLLRPIAEQSMCAPCHGLASRMDARVLERLPDRYPADRAVGFAEGDLRGWFWVEIPKAVNK